MPFIRLRIKIQQTFAGFPICLWRSWSSSLWLLQTVQKTRLAFLHLRSHTSGAQAQRGRTMSAERAFHTEEDEKKKNSA